LSISIIFFTKSKSKKKVYRKHPDTLIYLFYQLTHNFGLFSLTFLLNLYVSVPEYLDGVSQWSALQQKAKPPHTTMLHNIDPLGQISALRHGDWKIVIGKIWMTMFGSLFWLE
jgi:hypothetical protein